MSRSYLTDRERARKLAQEIAPSRVDAYFDKVQIWLKEKLPRSQQPEWLQKARRTHRAHKHHGAMRYHGDYVQRWQLRQPTRDELQWMSRLDGVLLNGVEVKSWTGCCATWTSATRHLGGCAVVMSCRVSAATSKSAG